MEKKHKSYLCPGEMLWDRELIDRFGGKVSGWKCATCGKVLRSGVHSLQHTPERSSHD